MNLEINNLDKSTSPYLRQHKDNPIAWQEYSEEVIEYAKSTKRPLFISVGYATCHWCHVMANDTFSNVEVAKFMNKKFVCIKVDREQRPDIDSFCMNFIQSSYGQGGWPLNVVMTPDLKPFFAATYLASEPKYNMGGFIDVMTQVFDFYVENVDDLENFNPRIFDNQQIESPNWDDYENQFDLSNGGFMSQTKFPPHCSLLFLLSSDEAMARPKILAWAKNVLDIMQDSGLADHVGGGFFRYCVDKNWEIPHFEKMLYDQAMMLISYSLGYKVFKDQSYKQTISEILFSLEDTFRIGDLYASGHDADTKHIEGQTYAWNEEELKNILGSQYDDFKEHYELIDFEEDFHIKRKSDSILAKTLYDVRKKRAQPSVDTKILTSWNSLLGIAFNYVERFTGIHTRVTELYNSIIIQKDTRSTHEGIKQKEVFLEDVASILLLQTYMFERGSVTKEELDQQKNLVMTFNIEGRWIENPNTDFTQVEAGEFDHPIPSSLSIVQWALMRYNIIKGNEETELKYKTSINFDAHNFIADFAINHWHYKTNELPIDSPLLSIFEYSDENIVCHDHSCTSL